MLFKTFKVVIFITAVLGILHMNSQDSYLYILFPIVIIVGVVFSFFNENDEEYVRMNGKNNSFWSWFFDDGNEYQYNNEYYFDEYNDTNTSYQEKYKPRHYTNTNTTAFKNYEYGKLSNKCKRNFKISVNDD